VVTTAPASPADPAPPLPPHASASSWPRRVIVALSDIKLAHSVFALPFAVLGAVMAARDWGRLPAQLGLVVVCMFLARTWAMLVNRLADWKFDRDNPRTARRAVASGRLSPSDGWVVALLCAIAFILTTLGFLVFFANPWPALLSAPVLAWIALYSYTKRFTALCHLFLGGALAASPIAAAIAVSGMGAFFDAGVRTNAAGLPAVMVWLAPHGGAILRIAGFVMLWVAGFDVAYALQDLDFDRRTGLRSIPAALGVRGSLWASRALHAGALVLLTLAARTDPRFGPIFFVAVGFVAVLLVFEHIVLARRGVAGLPLAFFTINGVVSLLLGAAGVADVLL
jgi:4-hydroxybenzoate polyprenyltransferase